ncbi:MAG: sodium:solute symporter family protein [Deltaproteobacteria bacterium]|nr:MAG: sodium:solute symporter family protein [Deltaproteobacteria bacterium]
MEVYLILGAYLLFTLALTLWSARRSRQTPDDYFLANRTFGPVVLFFTLIATNFSAFFFLGFSGMGYRVGYSYYPMMAFGTALVGLTFYWIGQPVSALGRSKGYITPPEMMGDLLQSRTLKFVFLGIMVVFTLPYLAVQPIGAGYVLQELTGNQIPYFWGASTLTLFIVLYVFVGGMRSVAWTDVLQGVLMLILMFLAIGIIASSLGGFEAANTKAYKLQPELFSEAGKNHYFTGRKWFSLMLLWFFCVPMFPQLFMRFFTPRSSKSLQTSAVLYPVVTALLFLCPVMVGVWGHIDFPGLTGKAPNNILPMMLGKHAPVWVGALVMVGALAAFMSTLDSQLLALSSMLTRDLYVGVWKRNATLREQVIVGRVLVVLFAIVGLIIAYHPPQTIFGMLREAFTGLAVLFPTTVAALYWRKTNATACVASILVGEGIWFGFYMGWIPKTWSLGFLPVLPILCISTLVLVVGSLLQPRTEFP